MDSDNKKQKITDTRSKMIRRPANNGGDSPEEDLPMYNRNQNTNKRSINIPEPPTIVRGQPMTDSKGRRLTRRQREAINNYEADRQAEAAEAYYQRETTIPKVSRAQEQTRKPFSIHRADERGVLENEFLALNPKDTPKRSLIVEPETSALRDNEHTTSGFYIPAEFNVDMTERYMIQDRLEEEKQVGPRNIIEVPEIDFELLTRTRRIFENREIETSAIEEAENAVIRDNLNGITGFLEGQMVVNTEGQTPLTQIPPVKGVELYNTLQDLFHRIVRKTYVSAFERQDVRDAIINFLKIISDGAVNRAGLIKYELFKFFYEINDEIERNPLDKFQVNFKRWRETFNKYIIETPGIPVSIVQQFNSINDIVLFRLSPKQVEACIDLVIYNMYYELLYPEFELMTSVLENIKAGVFINPKLDKIYERVPMTEALTQTYHRLLIIIAETFIVARAMWSFNLKFTDMLRSNKGYFKEVKGAGPGLSYIEAFPHLISHQKESGRVEGDRRAIATGIQKYVETYFANYDVKQIWITIKLKRVRYRRDANNLVINRVQSLEEGFWRININLANLSPILNDTLESDWNLINKTLSGKRTVLNAVDQISVEDALRSQTIRLQAVKEHIKQFQSDVDTYNNTWYFWLDEELRSKLMATEDQYKDAYIPDFDGEREWYSGLMISSFQVTAKINRPRNMFHKIERIVPVHCKEGLRRAYSALSYLPNSNIPGLSGLCLYQAHWLAMNLKNVHRTGPLFKIENRRERLIEDFSKLDPKAQDIFIRGDLQKYISDLKPQNIVVIIYEIDDWEAIMNNTPNVASVTPIVCWDGHAVCSTWDKLAKNFKKSFEIDNQEHSDDESNTRHVSDRVGKKIIPITGVDETDLKYENYFMDIETYDHKDDKGVVRMIPYLVVVVSEKLQFPKVFWGYNCVNHFQNWFKHLIESHKKKNLQIKESMKKERKKDKRIKVPRKFTQINMYGFNSYNFDYIPFLREWANWDDFKLQGSLTSVKTLKIGDATLYDLLRVLPMGSLAKQAETWKTAHKKKDFDHTKVTKNWLDNINMMEKLECIEYCINDCIVLKEVFEAYSDYVIKNYDISPYVYSAAALGYNIWRRSIAGRNYHIQGVNQGLYNKLQDSYKGGMVFLTMKELPHNVKEAYLYDINSSYPAVMRNYDIPTSVNGIEECEPVVPLTLVQVDDIIDADLYEIKNFEFKPEHWLPLIPKRTLDGLRYELKLNPVEYIWGVELKEALRTNMILKGDITKMIRFNTDPIYKSFIDKIYAQRLKCKEDKDELGDVFNKLIMNSVYGKKAQQLYPETMIVNDEKLLYYLGINADNITIENTESLGDGLYKLEFSDLQYYKQIGSNINIASFITAAGRANMCKAIRLVSNNWKDKCVIYGDTDSLLLTKKLPDEIIHDTKLGCWKLEHTFIEWIGIGAKMYCAKKEDGTYKMRFKGVARDFLTPLKYRQLLTKGSVMLKSGIVWRRHTDGYVFKTDDYKYIKPVDKRRFVSNVESYPY